MIYLKQSFVLIVLVLFTEIAVGQEQNWDGTISQDDGVTIVHNTATPLYATETIRLVQAFSIGGDEAFFEDLPLHQVRGVAVDEEGAIYVSDGGNARVAVFDAAGQLVRTFGGPGSGPGEFEALSKIKIGGDGHLYTLDAKLRRVSSFTRDGNFLQSIAVKERALDMAVGDDDELFLVTWQFRPQDAQVAIYNTGGKRTGSLVTPLPSSHAVALTGNAGRIARTPTALYYAFSYPYRIEHYDHSGVLQRIITREDDAFVAPASPASAGGSVMGADLPNRIGGLGVAGDGTLVVHLQYEDKPGALDFFSPEGKFLQSIILPDEHRLGAVVGDAVYTYIGGQEERAASVTKWHLEMK